VNKKLAQKYLQLEHSRNELLSKLGGIDKSILEAAPAKDKWSVAQIIFHLNRAESLSVLYVSKKMKGADGLKHTGVVAVIRIVLSKLALVLPLKFRAPKVLGEMPAEVKYDDIKLQWDETRKKLKDLLETILENDLKKPLFKQPVAGRMNIYQMLDFMQNHFDHHAKQMVSRL